MAPTHNNFGTPHGLGGDLGAHRRTIYRRQGAHNARPKTGGDPDPNRLREISQSCCVARKLDRSLIRGNGLVFRKTRKCSLNWPRRCLLRHCPSERESTGLPDSPGGRSKVEGRTATARHRGAPTKTIGDLARKSGFRAYLSPTMRCNGRSRLCRRRAFWIRTPVQPIVCWPRCLSRTLNFSAPISDPLSW
jgi:hypothetical protein